jgi:N-acetyl-gamma-glutamyl-phosphate reductase
MITAGIIGATGYAGVELFRLLLAHESVKKIAVSSVSFEGQSIDDLYPSLYSLKALHNGQGMAEKCGGLLEDAQTVVEKSDIVFTALPHGLAEQYAEICVKTGKKLIDLSADFRFDQDEAIFAQWYKKNWERPGVHAEAAYGLPELYREKIRAARIVGNPGCYVTSAILALLPALKHGMVDTNTVIVDSKSGVTGAGRNNAMTYNFCECGESISVYAVGSHRHQPEIKHHCDIAAGKDCGIVFTPHLLPMSRGIITDVYAPLSEQFMAKAAGEGILEKIRVCYADFYRDEPFVRVLREGKMPATRNVRYSNYCDIQVFAVLGNKMLQVVSVLDNMVKGAAGQAVQNMNLLASFPETQGLEMIPPAF